MAIGRRAFEVVDRFEAALSEYTGAPYVITTDCCTNALFLSMRYRRVCQEAVHDLDGPTPVQEVTLPSKTYVGVVQAARNAGFSVRFEDYAWVGRYEIRPLGIVDSARWFYKRMHSPKKLVCVSFQATKHLPIGRGGAILTDDVSAADWLRRARFDGRDQELDLYNQIEFSEGWHMYLPPDYAARGLWLMNGLPEHTAPQEAFYPDMRDKVWS